MREVLLTDLVSWGALVIFLLIVLGRVRVGLRKLKEARRQRKSVRRCALCGYLEAAERNEDRYGTCPACGAVNRRGRVRKLG